MGEEIETAGFTRDDFVRFADRLAEETKFAQSLFVTDGFSRSGHMLGFEIECWILDHNYFPASINQRLLETLAHPLVVPELSRFNVELNCEPLALMGAFSITPRRHYRNYGLSATPSRIRLTLIW